MLMGNTGLGSIVLALAMVATLSGPALAQADIDFGDDSSEWANDGECDDPRFAGSSMASELEDVDIARDATDCRTAFEAGEITLVETAAPDAEPTPATRDDEIDFGDDTSEWANDGECDDPRFEGAGMAVELEDVDIARDATDCRTAFEAGEITLATGSAPVADAIDFGDDSGSYPNDQECDDPRFVGTGMAEGLSDDNIARDATDCRNAFNDGTVRLDDGSGDTPASTAGALEAIANRIDFGDDSGNYPEDGECDDPDFVGSGAASDPLDEDRLADASDCRAAFLAGTVTLRAGMVGGGTSPAAFDYGTDTSRYANDGECDDMRFTGSAMAKKLDYDDMAADASDCRQLEADGLISIKPVYHPDYALGAPYDSSGVDFGDDSSSYANDEQCDDPRFEGPGTAMTLLDSDRMADASDCRAAFENGLITLRESEG